MSRSIVDVSIAVKWTIPEVHWEQAAALLESNDERLAPDLFGVELANALLKYVRRGEITPEHAVDRLEFSLKAVRLRASEDLAADALHLAHRHDLSAYDALYVALAQRERCTLITADRRLYHRVTNAGIIDATWVEDIPLPPGSPPTA